MSIEESISNYMLARTYMRKVGIWLGMAFVIQYWFMVLTSRNVFYSIPHTAACLATPAIIIIACYQLRKRYYYEGFSWLKCWTSGLKMFFYASLIEALFIVIYNKWINPSNLFDMHTGMIAQYEELKAMLNAAPNNPIASMNQMLDESVALLKAQEIQTPINAAFNSISNDLVSGALWMTILSFFLKKDRVAKDTKNNNDNNE